MNEILLSNEEMKEMKVQTHIPFLLDELLFIELQRTSERSFTINRLSFNDQWTGWDFGSIGLVVSLLIIKIKLDSQQLDKLEMADEGKNNEMLEEEGLLSTERKLEDVEEQNGSKVPPKVNPFVEMRENEEHGENNIKEHGDACRPIEWF